MNRVRPLLVLAGLTLAVAAHAQQGGEEERSPPDATPAAAPAVAPAPAPAEESATEGPPEPATPGEKVRAEIAAATAPAAEQARADAARLGENRGHQNVVSINTIVIGRGQIAVEYERAVHPRLSLFVSPQPVVLFTGDQVELGFFGELGARVFLVGDAPAGLFLAPELLFALSRQAASGVVQTQFKVGYGAMLGLTVILFERLVLSGGLGLRYLELENVSGRHVKALPRVSVGFAF